MDANDDQAPGQFLEQLQISRNNLKMAKSTLRQLSLKAVIKFRTPRPGLVERAWQALAEWGANLKSAFWGWEPQSPSPGHIIHTQLSDDALKKLPSTLKRDLIKMAVKDLKENDPMGEKCASQELCCFVAALLHSELAAVRLPTLDYTGRTPQTKAKFQMLLETIGAASPGLMVLHVQTLWTRPPPFFTENSALGDTFFRVLPRLKNLRVILLDRIHCDDWALQQFAVHATNLVVLKVELSLDVSSSGFKALSTLRHLRQFLFDGYYTGGVEHAKKCILLCAEYLPHLKGAGRFDSKFLSEYEHNELVQHQQLSKLSLANLSIGRGVEPHKNLQLPELESLSLWFPMNNVVGLCDRFSTISALELCEIKYASPETVMTVLHSVGGRLRSLSLIFAPQPLSLAKIFELCPQLESFKIEYCNIIDTPTVCWPENYLSCLNEVSVYRFRDETGRWNSLAVGFIMQLLKSPALRRLDIDDVFLTKREIKELLRLVQERCILESVVHFSWMNYFHSKNHLPPGIADESEFELLLNTIESSNPQMIFQRLCL